MESVAFETGAIATWPTKASWDADAADLVATMLDRWHLVPGEAFVGGESASVLRVTTADRSRAVLKVGFPHSEGIGEALALDAWAPRLSPAVLRQDAWTWSILLDDVVPGVPLSRHAVPLSEALEIGALLHTQLASVDVPAGVPGLSEIIDADIRAARSRLPGQRDELHRLGALTALEAGLAQAEALAATDAGGMLLHGDFNPGNILLGGEGAWLVIDPKPMRGDPEYDLWPLISQLGAPFTRQHPEDAIAGQLDAVVAAIGSDRDRTARWGHARTALSLSWILRDGTPSEVQRAATELAVWSAVSGS